nr:kinesin-like protein KIN-13A [Allium cepa]
MARWLQSAGLQHLASPNPLMQGYGAQTAEDKQKSFRLMRNLNLNGESAFESYTPTVQSFGASGASDGFYSPDLRGEFGAGLLDLHAVDDTELLPEHVMSEPFEPSPFVANRDFDDDFDLTSNRQQGLDGNVREQVTEKEISAKGSNVAKIKVVVRKRPLNKKELLRKEDDIVTVHDSSYLTVYEPKLKVDLTAYVEQHEFCFDAILDENVSNDEVYHQTVEPIIPTIFERTKATCFAYGQTGSGKTYTMQPLPLRAAGDIVRLLQQPVYRDQKYKLWLSYFEIYGGKLFDLLSDRRKLCMREDGRQQVCIVGLQEFEVSDVQVVKEFIEKGNSSRSTGSTGANEESSRSHAILQLVIKKQKEVKDTRRRQNNDENEPKGGKVVGKISFIDLAGSERGADTTDNDRQTRIEGAEINKSLLALKECIRALDNDQIHIPFRGSKLTEVLRDSFVGNSRTVMISCISPSAGSCEHTLNTLRYADRVKSLSKTGNPKKEQVAPKETLYSSSAEQDYFSEQNQEAKAVETDRSFSGSMASNSYNGREQAIPSFKSNLGVSNSQRSYSYQNAFNTQEDDRIAKVSPPRRKGTREEKPEKPSNWTGKETSSEFPTTNYKHQMSYESVSQSRQFEVEVPCSDREINAILEEEEALTSAHRKEIENTMEIVREEMDLLAEVDQPGSLIDNYVNQLSFLLSRKAAGLVSLQARLARFQHRLKEQEILGRNKH